MKLMLDSTCSHCGFRSSSFGLSVELAREIAQSHVCADGTRMVSGEPVERRVPGPGERTKSPEEREMLYRF
jgi:hypothetical protein